MSSISSSSRSLFFAFGIIVAGLACRAGIDKSLALQGGGEAVALWAQLQSLVEMVAGVVGIGIGQGVTVLVAQQGDPERRYALMRAALLLGAVISAGVAMIVLTLVFAGVVQPWLPVPAQLAAVAALAGWLGIAAAVLTSGWLGQHRQDRVFWLTGGMMMFPFVAALLGLSLAQMLIAEALAGGLVLGGVVAVLRRRSNDFFASCARSFAPGGDGRALFAYVPVGLAISLASPVALILIRGEISVALSWHDAGLIQALWRASDWVTTVMSGLLAYLVMPQLSSAVNAAAFRQTLSRAAIRIMLPTALLLFLLWLNQRAVLVALYDERFAVSDLVAGFFFAGDLLRVASWVILFALLARRATVWVTVGEFFSLPLFSAFVLMFSNGLSIERVAFLYLLTYVVYLAFNLVGLRWTLKGQA